MIGMRKASITPTKNYENFSLLNASSQSIKNLTEPVQSSKDKNLNILKLLTRKNTSFELANYNRHNVSNDFFIFFNRTIFNRPFFI